MSVIFVLIFLQTYLQANYKYLPNLQLAIFDDLDVPTHKTKNIVNYLKHMENTKKLLLVDGGPIDEKLKLSTQNLHYVNVLPSIVSPVWFFFCVCVLSCAVIYQIFGLLYLLVPTSQFTEWSYPNLQRIANLFVWITVNSAGNISRGSVFQFILYVHLPPRAHASRWF